MLVNCAGDNFAFTLDLEYGKGAVWHCDNGKLFMGVESEKQTTFYYSYTNMPTKGKINLDGKEILVEGNTWFDKQGGNFNFLSTHTHWEWFSMRFYDNEEIMLFNFPQQNYADGTYIKADKSYHRLNNYSMKPLNSVEVNGYKFSCGWEVDLPNVKDGHYTIIPLIEGQLNLAYFEQLCRIYDSNKKEVGLCFVELLPGVYNKKLDAKLLIKKV